MLLPEKEPLHNVFLSLGSNLGDRGENLQQALANIEDRIGKVVTISSFYVTEPVGFESENDFLNAVCKVRTKLQPSEILRISQSIEKDMGRLEKSENKVYLDRIIDVDLLLYDDGVLNSLDLILPHPHLHERLFVLQPLAEIAGELMHPVLHKTINQIKAELYIIH